MVLVCRQQKNWLYVVGSDTFGESKAAGRHKVINQILRKPDLYEQAKC
jgi:hypothetical protein